MQGQDDHCASGLHAQQRQPPLARSVKVGAALAWLLLLLLGAAAALLAR